MISQERAEEVAYIFYKNCHNKDRQSMAECLPNISSESSALRLLRKTHSNYPELLDEEDYKRWLERTREGGDLYKQIDPDTQVKLQRLRNQIQYWRSQYQESIDRMAKIESFRDEISKVVSALPPVKVKKIREDTKSKGEEIAVALFSDLHGGERIDPEATDFMGYYNIDIAARRLEIWAERVLDVISLHRKNYSIKELHILDLGDKVSGLIHEELEMTADIPPEEQFVVVGYLIAQIYLMLAREFEEIHIHSIGGNHARTRKKKSFKQPWVNFDYFAAQLTSLFCERQDNLHFHSYKSNKKIIEIGNKVGVIQHGDGIRSYQGIPFYGIIRSAKRQLAKQNSFRDMKKRMANFEEEALEGLKDVNTGDIDFLAMGHFHQLGILERAWGPIVINGCFPGPSEYSLEKDIVSRPGQWLLGFHRNGISWRYPLFLDNEKESPFNPLQLNI